ncbi:hypothetical protein AAFG13_38665 [Bradyrhizobium sp. B124]|uniref:hypothetical protein n=1 Tax=Bradyrhizobium sp. B124 TaxID=3140245 RepID=UPI0031843A6C
MPLDQAAAIFGTPPFHSCAGWNALAEPGPDGLNQIFHCALYFVPILIYYTRCRREELCGLMVDDVILDNGEIPYLHIEKNERRRIKIPQSQRNAPLHAEVLRLNLAAYVEAIKVLGYKLLFPDLYSPSSASPLGDRIRPRDGGRFGGSWDAASVRCTTQEEIGDGGRSRRSAWTRRP